MRCQEDGKQYIGGEKANYEASQVPSIDVSDTGTFSLGRESMGQVQLPISVGT
jgi:hypothetical protein